MKRFYKTVTTEQVEQEWSVLLDGKPIRTPLKNMLALPTQALAELVANEWDVVEETIDPKAMPHTGLAHAAIDALPTERENVTNELLAFGDTDLLFYRAPERALAEKQTAQWDPVVAWASERYGCEFAWAEGVMPVFQPAEGIAAMRKDVASLSDWQMAAFTIWVHKMGSLLLALGLFCEHLSLDNAIALSQLDEEHQAITWGEDEEAQARLANVQQEIRQAHQFMGASVD